MPVGVWIAAVAGTLVVTLSVSFLTLTVVMLGKIARGDLELED